MYSNTVGRFSCGSVNNKLIKYFVYFLRYDITEIVRNERVLFISIGLKLWIGTYIIFGTLYFCNLGRILLSANFCLPERIVCCHPTRVTHVRLVARRTRPTRPTRRRIRATRSSSRNGVRGAGVMGSPARPSRRYTIVLTPHLTICLCL